MVDQVEFTAGGLPWQGLSRPHISAIGGIEIFAFTNAAISHSSAQKKLRARECPEFRTIAPFIR